jgi:hypothetical protein
MIIDEIKMTLKLNQNKLESIHKFNNIFLFLFVRFFINLYQVGGQNCQNK